MISLLPPPSVLFPEHRPTIKLEPEQISITAGESQQISFHIYDAYENLIPDARLLLENRKGPGHCVSRKTYSPLAARARAISTWLLERYLQK